MPELHIERVAITHPDAQALIEQVQGEYVVRYGSRDTTPIDADAFEPPRGSFFVGYVGDEPVVTGAWRASPVEALGTSATAEIKRMYVVPTARGAGHARRMLAHLEQDVVAAGREALVLETGLRQPEAIELYVSAGYVPVPGFGHFKDEPLSRCFGKRLDPGPPRPAVDA